MSKIHLTALGLLNERPMHGYELKQVVCERHLDQWADVNPNSVYKALQALQGKGFIEGSEETEGNNPPRTVFSLTPEGRQELAKLVRHFLKESSHPHDFWLGVAFVLRVMTKRELLATISQRIDSMEQHQQSHRKHLRKVLAENPDLPFNWLTLIKMGDSMMKTHIACLRDLRQATEACDQPEHFKPEETNRI
ncbi:MAG: PadR family transcriptional regulator [Candidatus Cloacimonetes bacterium]|nr:PadR family transcriptional regulator [Candidatus Cloacimonadota bacterium]